MDSPGGPRRFRRNSAGNQPMVISPQPPVGVHRHSCGSQSPNPIPVSSRVLRARVLYNALPQNCTCAESFLQRTFPGVLLIVQTYITMSYLSSKIVFLKTKGNARKGASCPVLPVHTPYRVVITINVNTVLWGVGEPQANEK